MLSVSPKLRKHFNVAEWCYKPFFIQQHEGKALPIWLHLQTSLERVWEGFEGERLALLHWLDILKEDTRLPMGSPLITRVTHAISDPKTDSSPTRAPPCKCGYLYWPCLPLLFLFICVLALRTPVRYFCPREVGLWALGLRKKCLDFLLKCSWVTSLCISPWTSLFLSLSFSPHR